MNQPALIRNAFKNIDQTQSLELLAGEFSAQDAKAQALGLLSKSIGHHWVQSFKHQSESDELNHYSDEKMAELSLQRSDLVDLIKKAEENGLRLNIEANLKVSIA